MAKANESEKRGKDLPRQDRSEEQIRVNLNRFVEESGYSVTLVANLAGIAQATLNRYLTGENAVSAGALEPLAEVFGRTVADFFNPAPAPFDPARLPIGHFRARPGVQLTEEDRADIAALLERMESRRGKKQPLAKKR